MAVDRRLLFNVDWVLLGAVFLLSLIGVGTIASASQTGHSGLEVRQLYWLGIGLVAMLIAVSIDYRELADRAPLLYGASVLALIYVWRFGPRIAGTRRWIVVAGMQLQPSELVKLTAALFLAKVFSEYKKDTLGLGDVLAPGAAIGLLTLLIAVEPDLGSAFCLVPLFLTGAVVAGLRIRSVVALVPAVAVVGTLWWFYAAQPYQKERVEIFLGTKKDPRGAGYQKDQSQIAVGSGGLSGKGFKQGTQSQLGYLPARHTDFIFSVLAEEMGFMGVVTVLGLYLLVLWRAFETAQQARDRVGTFLAAGVAAVMSFQVVYNVAMVAGLVPVKGLPLPLMSYGGSSVISSLLAIGLILNVRMRRFAN